MSKFLVFCLGNIPPGVNPEAYSWFQTVDSDRSGYITLKELKQALVNSNWSAFNDETCILMLSKYRYLFLVVLDNVLDFLW